MSIIKTGNSFYQTSSIKECINKRSTVFWNKVTKTDTCWIWTAGRTRAGYGLFSFKGKSMLANRFCWMIHNGEIPKDMCILHTCDNPRCVNINHLFLGTKMDNYNDMVNKRRVSNKFLRIGKNNV